ncbi:MAG: hypothetical protein II648_04335 [Bacteroidales bacterium]|nr:hypothetical protein [Bacteroidales bacterium]
MIDFEPVYSHRSTVYNLPGFEPGKVDGAYLKALGVGVEPSEETLEALRRGSEVFERRFREHLLIPRQRFCLEDIVPASVTPEIHNYTGRCPTLTYEINPVRGCTVGCQYCLVSDGVHEQELVAYDNYHLYVRRLLEEHNGPGSDNARHYYYFSPKTEAFQEATLYTGIAHRILREFIEHFRRCPHSNARLFIASKAGAKHLQIADGGETVLDLFARLKGRMQFNTSVSIMPDAFRDILEPYAAPLSERLEAVRLCSERGVAADSALVQPIITPWLTREHIESFFGALRGAGIINYKPEFLTACVENLSMLGQYLGWFDKGLERQLYEDYLMPSNESHRKQRARIAPDKARSLGYLKAMMECTGRLGMSVSICYWVRKQLGIEESQIPLINRNGFQCLGYQSKLFGDV